MKNLIQIESNCSFLCCTPNGADDKTCPCCDCKVENNYYKDDVFEDYEFCEGCGIVFDIGCKYEVRGCTSDIYNGHFIGKWRYKEQTYTGMPQFSSLDELHNEFKNIDVLEWVCINNGTHSDSNVFYSYDKYPQYYKPCNLKK
jgi:hypothetical protein